MVNVQLWQNPGFPDVSILQDITTEILINFRKCKELRARLQMPNNDINELSRMFNDLTEQRAVKSLRMSRYAGDIVEYIHMLTEENVSVSAIIQTLNLLLNTAKSQKDDCEKLKRDYNSFYNILKNLRIDDYENNEMEDKDVNIKLLIIESIAKPALFFFIVWLLTCYSRDYVYDFSKFIIDTIYQRTSDDSQKLLEKNEDPMGSGYSNLNDVFPQYGEMNVESLTASQKIFNSRDNTHATSVNFNDIQPVFLSSPMIAGYALTLYVCKKRKPFFRRWRILLNRFGTNIYRCFTRNGYEQIPTENERASLVQYIERIRDRFPVIIDNIDLLCQFWDAQIVTINDNISFLKSVDATKEVKIPHQIGMEIEKLWNEEHLRCRSCHYNLNERVILNSMPGINVINLLISLNHIFCTIDTNKKILMPIYLKYSDDLLLF
ncbi:20887_t:CDS:2 [Cetraspora pellucida]|uniref:20887_t:CDS:1 n=1 Tax=Cetraspora pellucida TaxID=1433469 RepID=A0A9N9HXN6_9GLOM|nr:20887_t:CDS:2 [Cetraspora pellucida]